MSASEANGTRAHAGPFDVVEWPAQLTARVVMPAEDPHIHGYAVEGDLARHYSFGETLYLTLCGELPSAEIARAFEVALIFLSPVAIGEGPTHAAALTRLCAAPARGVLAVGAIGLAERARFVLDQQREFLGWLASGAGAPPASALSHDALERESVARLRAALPRDVIVPALDHPLTRTAALVAVLVFCGLSQPEQLEAAWTLAGFASCVAEALATQEKSFRSYPMNLPAFHYEPRP